MKFIHLLNNSPTIRALANKNIKLERVILDKSADLKRNNRIHQKRIQLLIKIEIHHQHNCYNNRNLTSKFMNIRSKRVHKDKIMDKMTISKEGSIIGNQNDILKNSSYLLLRPSVNYKDHWTKMTIKVLIAQLMNHYRRMAFLNQVSRKLTKNLYRSTAKTDLYIFNTPLSFNPTKISCKINFFNLSIGQANSRTITAINRLK